MPFDIENSQIVKDFTNSLNQIFGGNSSAVYWRKGGSEYNLFKKEYGGASALLTDQWVGNSTGTKTIRYGFSVMYGKSIQSGKSPYKMFWPESDSSVFYLQIPPKSIKQREIFANNIQATRRGVIVESEGVVFKEIVIQGNTGIFPGTRGGSNVATSNFFNGGSLTSAPGDPQGVSADSGISKASNVNIISGYEEFLRLRQFFLRYAKTKLDRDGDAFLIWINEKDGDTLVVEPVDFIMDRDAKSPLTYNYTIVLKAIGNLASIFGTPVETQTFWFNKIANVAANTAAAIAQSRAVFNQSVRLLQRFSQAIDQTFLGPLRQLQYAAEDLSNGISTVLSLPGILQRNASPGISLIRDSISPFSSSAEAAATTTTTAVATSVRRNDVESDPEIRRSTAAATTSNNEVLSQILNDSRIPIPKSFVENLKQETQNLANNLADYVNLGDATFNEIKNRTVTNPPNVLKEVSDSEFLLLGTFQTLIDSYNQVLASNAAFQTDAEEEFNRTESIFNNPNLPDEFKVDVTKPNSVREVIIEQNDTLERIAQKELGDALRWTEIVILNKLKPPYISSTGGDGIKKPGEKLIIGEI